jgi:hypothetical protein
MKCKVCDYETNKRAMLKRHYNSKKHTEMVDNVNTEITKIRNGFTNPHGICKCMVCNLVFTSTSSYYRHLSESDHDDEIETIEYPSESNMIKDIAVDKNLEIVNCEAYNNNATIVNNTVNRQIENTHNINHSQITNSQLDNSIDNSVNTDNRQVFVINNVVNNININDDNEVAQLEAKVNKLKPAAVVDFLNTYYGNMLSLKEFTNTLKLSEKDMINMIATNHVRAEENKVLRVTYKDEYELIKNILYKNYGKCIESPSDVMPLACNDIQGRTYRVKDGSKWKHENKNEDVTDLIKKTEEQIKQEYGYNLRYEKKDRHSISKKIITGNTIGDLIKITNKYKSSDQVCKDLKQKLLVDSKEEIPDKLPQKGNIPSTIYDICTKENIVTFNDSKHHFPCSRTEPYKGFYNYHGKYYLLRMNDVFFRVNEFSLATYMIDDDDTDINNMRIDTFVGYYIHELRCMVFPTSDYYNETDNIKIISNISNNIKKLMIENKCLNVCEINDFFEYFYYKMKFHITYDESYYEKIYNKKLQVPQYDFNAKKGQLFRAKRSYLYNLETGFVYDRENKLEGFVTKTKSGETRMTSFNTLKKKYVIMYKNYL